MSDGDRAFDSETLDDLLDATVEVPALLLLGAACCGCGCVPASRHRGAVPGCCR